MEHCDALDGTNRKSFLGAYTKQNIPLCRMSACIEGEGSPGWHCGLRLGCILSSSTLVVRVCPLASSTYNILSLISTHMHNISIYIPYLDRSLS